ncbi:MAG TPA: hypothetical protein VFV50_18030 [Bdellovibrionales bacterium]|nr:hypothetical protein [Bdellovibrionales bacterium]
MRFLIFMIPAAFAFGYLEYRFYQTPTMYSKKREALERERESLRGLILGTSHAVHAYAPEALPLKAVNLAHVSQSLQIDKELVARQLDRLPRLCFVVLNLSGFSFEYRLDGSDDEARNGFYRRYYGFPGDARPWQLWHPKYLTHFSLFQPDIARGLIWSGFRKPLGEGITPLGGLDTDQLSRAPNPINAANGEARAAYHNKALRPELAGETTAALRAMLGLLSERKVAVFLARSPAHAHYHSKLDPEAERRFALTATTFGVPFADYLRDARFGDDSFFDVDHLNARGANAFTSLLWREHLAALAGPACSPH